MKLGDGVEQAIHSVAMLSGLSDGGVLSAAALAEFHGVSTSYLLKHLQALSGAGILDTVPGPKGGYRLAKAAGRDHAARYRACRRRPGAGVSLQRNPPARAKPCRPTAISPSPA